MALKLREEVGAGAEPALAAVGDAAASDTAADETVARDAVADEAAAVDAVPANPGDAPREAVVRVRGYGRRFGGRTVLSGIDLDLRDGELVALLGASGSGKSTLLRALSGQDPEADGHIIVPRERAVAFQDHRLLPWKRVWRNVLIGVSRVDGRKAGKKEALAALNEVGIAGRADAWPGTLSGGESQRVALARAFIRRPRLLLLDEPFGALDALTRLRMHALLRDLCARHHPATLLVTHDVDEAISLADRILVISGGRISLDYQVAGDRSGADGLALRGQLLRELGVDPGQPAEHAEAAND
jgi:sulfonate transport system ATP-binding protein